MNAVSGLFGSWHERGGASRGSHLPSVRRMVRRARYLFPLAVLAAGVTAACGGGSDSLSSPVHDIGTLQALVNADPPPAASSGRIAGLLGGVRNRANTLLMTVLQDPGERGDASLELIDCRTIVCVTPDGRVDLSGFEFGAANYQPIMTRHDLPVFHFESGRRTPTWAPPDDTPGTAGYGVWLKHSAFLTLAGPFHVAERSDDFSVASLAAFRAGPDDDGSYVPRVGALSFGDATGSRPLNGTAAWVGVMTGIDMVLNHPVQGDARVSVNFPDSTVDVAFTRIFDLETRTLLTRPGTLPETGLSEASQIRFSNLPLTDAGAFGVSDDTRSLEGWFYGPGHQEVGGVFQHGSAQMIGAFGARRVNR